MTNMTNRVSVVMCTYNGSRFLEEQLESIRIQTRQPDELVVCDDGSQDETCAILKSFSQIARFRVRVYINRERLGSTRNFDQAIRLADGDLIALADQDDRWMPQKLETLAPYFEDEEVSGVFTDASLIDQIGNPLGQTSLWAHGHLNTRDLQRFRQDPVGLLLRQDVATGATMVFRAAVRNLYLTIPHEWMHDGWLAWMMVLYADTVGRLAALPERLIEYRTHSAQQTGSQAALTGSRSDPITVRIEKARHIGHVHHQALANRLKLLLDHWTQESHSANDATSRRISGAIRLLEKRSKLPARIVPRLFYVCPLFPAYYKYARGFESAVRDVLA